MVFSPSSGASPFSLSVSPFFLVVHLVPEGHLELSAEVFHLGVALDLEAKKIRVRRKLEGRHEVVEAPLPALLTVVREINRPRYPTVPRRLKAENTEIKLWDNKVLELDELQIGMKGSPTMVNKIFSPEREKGEIVGDEKSDPEEIARSLLERLMQKEILDF